MSTDFLSVFLPFARREGHSNLNTGFWGSNYGGEDLCKTYTNHLPALLHTNVYSTVELQRLREACGGLDIDVTHAQFSGGHHTLHAITLMGSCDRHPRRSPRPTYCYITSQHWMEQKARTHVIQRRSKHSVSHKYKSQVQKLQLDRTHQGKMVGQRRWWGRPIPRMAWGKERSAYLLHHQGHYRHTHNMDLLTCQSTASLVCQLCCNSTQQS